jgi:hypothetical protein
MCRKKIPSASCATIPLRGNILPVKHLDLHPLRQIANDPRSRSLVLLAIEWDRAYIEKEGALISLRFYD